MHSDQRPPAKARHRYRITINIGICRSILIVQSIPAEELAIYMCLQYGIRLRWVLGFFCIWIDKGLTFQALLAVGSYSEEKGGYV